MPVHKTPAFIATLVSGAVLLGLFAGCGKATVKAGSVAPGFSLAALRAGTTAVIVDAEVALSGFTPGYQSAYDERFGTADSLSSHLTRLLLDSLDRGAPRIPVAAAPALNPRYILIVRDIVLARTAREIPSGLLPTGGQRTMQAAGGGTSEGWSFSFVVNVWETAKALPEDGGSAAQGDSASGADLDGGVSAATADTTNGLLRHSFSVSGSADVALYAYKTAMTEAVNAAAAKTVRHLRGR